MELDNSKTTNPVFSEALPGRRHIRRNIHAILLLTQDYISFLVPTTNQGTTDTVGFSTVGVAFVRNSMNVQKREAIPSFGYDAGWRVDKHIRLVADTSGNKHGYLVGFGEMCVCVSLNNGGNPFQTPKMVLPDFSYAAGWHGLRQL
jgi:hypothetical protein